MSTTNKILIKDKVEVVPIFGIILAIYFTVSGDMTWQTLLVLALLGIKGVTVNIDKIFN